MGEVIGVNQLNITSWKDFNENVRDKAYRLLSRLDEFPNSILVTGCQRSGTHMLSGVISQSEGISNTWIKTDIELDSALILSGYRQHVPKGRYCFQTTYLNERVGEYFEHTNGHQILWVLRNPVSVVYSMLFNWGTNPNRVFNTCGIPVINGRDKWMYSIFGATGVSMLRKACWAYNGKTAQVFDLLKVLGPGKVMVVDYDDLVTKKAILLPRIYEFIGLKYKAEYEDQIHSRSLDKKSRMGDQEIATVLSLCEPTYRKARSLISNN